MTPPRKTARDERGIRASLLMAAEELFSEKPYDRVSIRDLAARAKVNSAMIQYYFRGKKGLYYAFLEHSLGPVLLKMQTVLSRLQNCEGQDRIREYVDEMITILGDKPWFVKFVFREILLNQHDLQKFYVNSYARHVGRLLPQVIEGEMELGRYSSNLNPRFAALSLLSMMFFPFIAQGLAGPAFGIEYDERFRKRLADHTVKLFESGAFEISPASFG